MKNKHHLNDINGKWQPPVFIPGESRTEKELELAMGLQKESDMTV